MLTELREQLKKSSVSFGPSGGPVAVVDDDMDDRAFLRHEVKFLFGEVPVKFFENGAELMQWLKDEEQKGRDSFDRHKPKLILLDLHMPKMNGIDTLHMLHTSRQCADIPVIVVSGTLDSDEVEAAYQNGAFACLAKPAVAGKWVVL